jgi:hypothetical protein
MAMGFKKEHWRELSRDAAGKIVLAAFAAGVLAAVLVFGKLGWHVLRELAPKGRMFFISEMRPLWEFPEAAVPHAVASIVTLLLVWGGGRERAGRCIFWGIAFVFGLLVARNYAMSILLMSAAALVGIPTLKPLRKQVLLRSQGTILVIAALVAVVQAVRASEPIFGGGLYEGIKALEAAGFVKGNSLPEPIFNSFEVGGCLNYVWEGEPKTFIDGRSVGSETHIATFRSIVEGNATLSSLKAQGTNTIVTKALFRNSGRIYPMLFYLFASPEWSLVNASDALVFVRTEKLDGIRPLNKADGWDFVGRETAMLEKRSEAPYLPYNYAIVALMKRNISEARRLYEIAAQVQPQLASEHRFIVEMTGLAR